MRSGVQGGFQTRSTAAFPTSGSISTARRAARGRLPLSGQPGMVSGLSEASSEPSRALAAIARQAQRNPAAVSLLEKIGPETIEQLAMIEPELHTAFGQYLQEYGFRALRYDLAYPTLQERPEWILGLMHDQIRRGYDPAADEQALTARRAALVAEARGTLAARPADLQRFDRALRRAERAYPLREEHGFYDAGGPIALGRYAILEAAGRLVAGGQLARVDDFCYLEIDALRAALRNPSHAPLHEMVIRRKGERAWVMANPGPPSYGKRLPGPPSFKVLPPGARFMHEAVMWTIERAFAAEQSGQRQTDASALKGISAAAGTYTGPVRVIRDED